MSDLANLLLPDEQVAFATKKHVIIFIYPLLWTAITLVFLYLSKPFVTSNYGVPLINSIANLAWIPGIVAIYTWLTQGLIYLTSHFIVTNRRVIMREGFFFRHATETRLSAVAEIKIDQPLLGRVLNYGSITINSFGGGSEVFDLISGPYMFQRKVAENSDTGK